MAETYITNTEKSQRMLKNKNKLYRLTPIRMAIERTNKQKTTKPENNKCWQHCGETETLCTTGGAVKCCSRGGNQDGGSQTKRNFHMTQRFHFPMCTRGLKARPRTDVYAPAVKSALVIEAEGGSSSRNHGKMHG